MKKVLIITYYWPPGGGAGVQRWLKFAKYLPEFGWQSIIYTPSNGEMPVIDLSLEKAVESPRIHYEEGKVHIEPGVPDVLIEKLKKHYEINRWDIKDMYFGGVHCVNSAMEGWGDSRRGGSSIGITCRR